MSAHPAGPRSAALLADAPAPVHPADAQSAKVWPASAGRDVDGVMTIAGHRVDALVAEHGSPVYLLDEGDARARARAYRDAYGDGNVFYAAKAFLSVEFARWMLSEGLGIDVCTLGELRTALAAGARGEQLLVHGNNKSHEELHAAVEAGVRYVVVDSLEEIDRLQGIAAASGQRVDVLVRVTVGVEAHTHEFIATAHEDQKFGFSLANDAALAAVASVVASPSLHLAGLHSHIGSQIFDEQGFLVAAHRLIALCAQVRDRFGEDIAVLDLGGGAGIAYVAGDDPISIESMASLLCAAVAAECAASGLPVPRILVEPGRSVVGPAGVTVYTVGTVKPVAVSGREHRMYASVDGGMSDNIRTSLYDAEYTVAHASRSASPTDAAVRARVVGKHCESGDIVVRDARLLADTAAGELLAVAATGAYCRAMASNYNSVPRPAVVAVRPGTSSVLIRRETIDDLLSLDAGVNP